MHTLIDWSPALVKAFPTELQQTEPPQKGLELLHARVDGVIFPDG